MKDLISALRGYFPSPTECEKAADELGRKAMQCAVLTVERDELRADLDAERDAAELKSACITGMRQEVTAWSMTVENLEAERDALKALNLKLALALVGMAYEAGALTNIDRARELMIPFEPRLESIFTEEPIFEDQVLSILKETNHD